MNAPTTFTPGVLSAAKALSDKFDAMPTKRAADDATADAMRDRMARQSAAYFEGKRA